MPQQLWTSFPVVGLTDERLLGIMPGWWKTGGQGASALAAEQIARALNTIGGGGFVP